jgi:hypothetical protein
VDDQPVLYHYTCSHSAEALGTEPGGPVVLLLAARELVELPGSVPWPGWFVWLTDMATPHANALGLTRETIQCDRTRYRYRVVNAPELTRWVAIRRLFPPEALEWLEAAPGARPMHWWVSPGPVAAVYDPEP